MIDILFGQSYYLKFDPKLWESMQPYPPLGTLYAASYMRELGYEVGLFDAMLAGSEADWEREIRRQKPRFAVLYEDNFNYLSKMCLGRMREAAYSMLKFAREQGCITIACGSDASDHPLEFMKHGADYVLIGEGERTLGELIDRLSGRSAVPLEQILGLAHAGGINPPRPDIKDLDGLPFPAWDLVDVERYRSIWMKRHGYTSMNMVTTRGCPFHCNWCAKPIWGQRYNARSPENVAEELHWLKTTYQPDHIWFADDILGLKPGWLAKYAQEVERLDARFPFKCLNRADLLLREGEIDALKQAGCRSVWIGAESGSQKVLDAMDKGIRVEQIEEASRRLQKAEIQVGFFLQFGYPGETREDIGKTFEMVRRCSPDDIGMSVAYPLPGTRFHQAVKARLGEKQHWEDSSDLAMLFPGMFSTRFYRQLHVVLHKEFRLRKAFAAMKDFDGWKTRPRGMLRSLKQIGASLVTLPAARMKLAWLGSAVSGGVGQPLPHLPAASASQPTPQEE